MCDLRDNWWSDGGMVREFAHVLHNSGVLNSALDVLVYYEKPWTFDSHFQDYCDLGYPDLLSDTKVEKAWQAN